MHQTKKLTLQQVADSYSVTTRTIKKWVRLGYLPKLDASGHFSAAQLKRADDAMAKGARERRKRLGLSLFPAPREAYERLYARHRRRWDAVLSRLAR